MANKSSADIHIKDIRFMFSGHYGASIAPEAPPGRFHVELPASLAASAEEYCYIPAEKLSDLLRSVFRPLGRAGTALTTNGTVFCR